MRVKLLLSRFTDDPSHEYASIITSQKQLAFEHSHDYFEIFMVNHGTALHRVNGTSHELSKGTVVLIRPDDMHCYVRMSPNFEIINMLIPSSTLGSLFEYLGEGFEPGRLLEPANPPAAQISPNEYTALVNQLKKLVLSKKLMKGRSDAIFRITLMNLLVTCFPLTRTTDRVEIPVWLQWLYLEMMKKENYKEGLPAMNRLSGKSEEHLARTCRKYLHRSPTEFINDLRLEHTAQSLIYTKEKIIDICADAGFESLSYYYRLFRKKYGLSPGDFREKSGNFEIVPGNGEREKMIDTGLPRALTLDGRT